MNRPWDISCFFVIILNPITSIVLLNMKLYHLGERAFCKKQNIEMTSGAILTSPLCLVKVASFAKEKYRDDI